MGWWWVGTGLTGGEGGFELGSETSGGTLESPRGEYGTTLARVKLSSYCIVVGITLYNCGEGRPN
jgi:hypothetical protein